MSLNSNNLLIIAEIGQVLNNDNTQDKITLSDKIKSQDSYMFNNNGDIITDVENILGNSNNNGNDLNKEEKYFIFNKKYEKEVILKMLDESTKKIISNYDSQLNLDYQNLPDVYTHFNLLIEKSSQLKYIKADDIKYTYEKMLEFFENYKVIYTTFKLNSHICEIFKNNYKNQNYSINALISNINKISEICENNKNEAISEINILSKTKESSCKILAEGLENLRKIELHPILQTNEKKYLIDIYLDVNKVETTKDDLIKKEEFILKCFREKSAIYSNESNKLVNEKAKSITEIKNDWSSISLEYDNKLNELINEPNKIYEDLLQDFLFFKQSLMIIFEYLNSLDSNDNKDEKKENEVSEQDSFEKSCQKINFLKNKYNDFSSLTQLQSKLEPINELSIKMRKNLENFSVRINKIFNVFFSIQQSLKEVSEKFSQIKEKIMNLKECFNKLKNPSKFPIAYESSLEEIKRRMVFNYKLKMYFNMLENFVKKETDLRKKFKSTDAIYLPLDTFTILKNFNLKLKCEISPEDDLDKFPKLLNEDEVKLLAELDQDFNRVISSNNSINDNLYQNNNKSINSNDNQKIKELSEEIIKKEKTINNLQLQLEMSINSIDKISSNFRFILSMRDKEIKKKAKECDNLVNYINNKINKNIQTCPMCCEGALNNDQYSNINMFLNEMEKKLSNKDSLLQQLEEKYNDLIIQTTHMKKIFFDHMNLKIANYNLNAKINGGQYNSNKLVGSNNYNSSPQGFPSTSDFQILKNIINDEKIKNNNLLTELNISKAKYDSLLCDMKKMESKSEQLKLKLNAANEKLLNIMKENDKFKDELSFKEKQKNSNENTIIELKQNIKQIIDEKKIIEEKKNKEIMKNKNKSLVFKDIKEGDRCIFVPHSENMYVCINLTQDLNQISNKYYRCDIILDFSTFDEEKKKLIIENSLILIGTINELKEVTIKEGETNPYEIINDNEINNDDEEEFSGNSTLTSIKSFLKSSNSYHLAKIGNIDYIIGFPGEELVFMNYNNFLLKKEIS